MQQQQQQTPPPLFNPYQDWEEPVCTECIEPDASRLANKISDETRNEAFQHVLGLSAGGSTNINDALVKSLQLVEKVKVSERLPSNVRPTIIFLTDGQPTVGVTSSHGILKNVKEANAELKVPVYGLGM